MEWKIGPVGGEPQRRGLQSGRNGDTGKHWPGEVRARCGVLENPGIGDWEQRAGTQGGQTHAGQEEAHLCDSPSLTVIQFGRRFFVNSLSLCLQTPNCKPNEPSPAELAFPKHRAVDNRLWLLLQTRALLSHTNPPLFPTPTSLSSFPLITGYESVALNTKASKIDLLTRKWPSNNAVAELLIVSHPTDKA